MRCISRGLGTTVSFIEFNRFSAFWLFSAGLAGFIVFFYGCFSSYAEIVSGKLKSYEIFARIFDHALTLPYAFFISVWGILYVQFWNRRNRYIAGIMQ